MITVIFDHLEQQGYQIRRIDPNDENMPVYITHPNNPTFHVVMYQHLPSDSASISLHHREEIPDRDSTLTLNDKLLQTNKATHASTKIDLNDPNSIHELDQFIKKLE